MKEINFNWEEDVFTFSDKKQVSERIKKRAKFCFVSNREEITNSKGSFCVNIDGNKLFSERDLLNDYYIKFEFPSYFGFNWDALTDCLRDLDWIEPKNVVIYHKTLPQLNEKKLKTYLDILRTVIGDWGRYDEHNIDVYFNINDYNKIKTIFY